MVEVSMELRALADRIEALTGADGKADALTRCAMFAPAGYYVEQSKINGAWCVYEVGYSGKARIWEGRGVSLQQRQGSFTASLDAAMTLVPEGRHTELAMQDRHSGNWKWTLRGGYGVRSEARAATPALALTAAALRARASLLDSPHTKGDEA